MVSELSTCSQFASLLWALEKQNIMIVGTLVLEEGARVIHFMVARKQIETGGTGKGQGVTYFLQLSPTS
jgi:hypothetical protein